MSTPEHYNAEAGCGQRLRKAREAANLSLDDVAKRLKMPVRVVESLEAEDWSRLGAPVFIRGQLRSYGRLLGLATAPLHVASGVAPIQPSKLQPRTYTPPMQRVAELFAKRAVYVVITAALAIPVWVATRTHFAVPLQSSSTIDQTAVLTRVAAGNTPASAAKRTPVVASLTPVKRTTAAVNRLSLRFKDDSWVRLTAVDGRLLEEAVLAAGDVRELRPGEVGEIVIGNASAVEMSQQGRILDLKPFQRANVARFTVSSDGSLQVVAQ